MTGFRPLFWPTVITVPALAVLISLGLWQLDRRDWKNDLIERTETRSGDVPVPLPESDKWASLDLDAWEYRPVSVSGEFDHDNEAHVFTTLSDPRGQHGGPGFWVITPLHLDDGTGVLVNRGFVPEPRKDGATRIAGQVESRQSIIGLVRRGEMPGRFTPARDDNRNMWFVRDVHALAVAAGVARAAPFFIDATTEVPGGLPQAGETRLTFRNAHLSYALTWFGLALALVVVYCAFHAMHIGHGTMSVGHEEDPEAGVGTG